MYTILTRPSRNWQITFASAAAITAVVVVAFIYRGSGGNSYQATDVAEPDARAAIVFGKLPDIDKILKDTRACELSRYECVSQIQVASRRIGNFTPGTYVGRKYLVRAPSPNPVGPVESFSARVFVSAPETTNETEIQISLTYMTGNPSLESVRYNDINPAAQAAMVKIGEAFDYSTSQIRAKLDSCRVADRRSDADLNPIANGRGDLKMTCVVRPRPRGGGGGPPSRNAEILFSIETKPLQPK